MTADHADLYSVGIHVSAGGTMPALTDPVGLVEIAEMFGVERATAYAWRTRAKTMKGKKGQPLPEPVGRISGSPLWERDQIIAWGHVTGRLNGGETV